MKTNMALGGAYFFSFLGSDGGSQAFQTDDLYHQYLYHNVSELLIHDYVISGDDYEASFHRSAHRRVPWQDFPDWMHEAWARVQEMDRFGNAAVACHEEVARTDFQRGKRGQYVEKLQAFLAAGKLVPFSEISRLIRDRFTTKIHMQIWYMMDYLRRRDPAKFPVLIARTKCISCERNDEKEGFLRALEEVYNLTPLGFEEAWQADLAKAKGE